MHELSIAKAIFDLAQQHVPAGCALRSVRLVAGPMRAIEPDAMQFAWQAVAGEDIHLDLETLPWTLRCPDCGGESQSQALDYKCACGNVRAYPIGGNELQVASIEVDETLKGEASCESRSSKT